MKAARELHDTFGVSGSYILCKLLIEASRYKSGRLPVNSSKLEAWAKDWRPTFTADGKTHGMADLPLIRGVIKWCKDNSVLTVIQAKSGHFIEFSKDYVIPTDKVALKHSMKVREASADKSKPADVHEVRIYMEEIGCADAQNQSLEFFDYWTERDWRRKLGAIKDWKATANRWVRSWRQRQGGQWL